MDKLQPIMLDIETLGTSPGAAIVAIGAIKFSWITGKPTDKFYLNVSAKSCVDHGLKVESGTIDWWKTQPKEARDAWMVNPQPLPDALNKFSDWFGKNDHEVWCNGMNFDFPYMEVAFNVAKVQIPWKYFRLNDFRTIVNLFNARDKFKAKRESGETGVYHNALDDCIAQAEFLVEMIGELKK
jgi:DNA polymerase III epsilon subunit-like protein